MRGCGRANQSHTRAAFGRRTMRRYLCCILSATTVSVILSWLIAGFPIAVRAAGSNDLQAQLETGEFAAALNAAQALPVGSDRDAVLAQVAIAQNRAGARGAA